MRQTWRNPKALMALSKLAKISSTMGTEKNKNILLWLVAIGFFMETLDSTIVNTALSTMARVLSVSPTSMQSVVISYSLTLAIFIPASAWLTDRFGTRRVYFSAIIIFSLGSLLCAVSTTLPALVASRVLQGCGGSMLLPVGRLSILRAFPGKQYIGALSFVAVPALIGPLLGPTLGGWLVEYMSWHWIFLINIPIGIIGCVATFKYMQDDVVDNPRGFDLLGFSLLATFMLTLSLALDGLAELAFPHALVYLLIILGVVSLVSYFFHASKSDSPILSLKVFETRTYNIGLLGNLFSRLGSGGMPFLIPLFLQLCLGYSPFEAGLTMLPLSIAGIAAKKIITPLITKTGYRSFLVVNTLLVGFGMASFALITHDMPSWLRIALLFFFGSVNSMQFTAMNTLTMRDLDPLRSSNGNTIFSMVQMLAMSFSVATVGSILNAFMSQYEKVEAFHTTFLCMGAITCLSTVIFWQLQKDEKVKDALEKPPMSVAQ
jgi:EmrB/QacA subfamily drug resistance transporter